MRTQDTIVRARINKKLKRDVRQILSCLGLSMSDAINTLFSQIKLKRGLPFDIKVPNTLTQKTLKKSAKGKQVARFNNANELFRDLGID